MSIKFLVLEGGVFWVLGGGECRFYFYGRADFSDKGKNPEGKNFRKLLRRKQSSAKISKISRNTIKSSVKVRSEKSSEISSANIFSFPRSFQRFLPFAFFYPLALSDQKIKTRPNVSGIF